MLTGWLPSFPKPFTTNVTNLCGSGRAWNLLSWVWEDSFWHTAQKVSSTSWTLRPRAPKKTENVRYRLKVHQLETLATRDVTGRSHHTKPHSVPHLFHGRFFCLIFQQSFANTISFWTHHTTITLKITQFQFEDERDHDKNSFNHDVNHVDDSQVAEPNIPNLDRVIGEIWNVLF
jgi:hypothetical protein